MTPLIKSEFRKLFTVLSTYVIVIIALMFVGFFSYYEGYSSIITNPQWLSLLLNNVASVTFIFAALVAVLLVGHEYRHNLISYTLTISNSRTKVLFAKALVVLVFSLVFATAVAAFAAGMYTLGRTFSPNVEAVSAILYWSDVWRTLFYVSAFAMLGLVLTFLTRSLIVAIAAIFVIPIAEGLLSILLKDNSKYMPFTALEQVNNPALLSAGKGALLFAAYFAAIWIINWLLFLRRDAN